MAPGLAALAIATASVVASAAEPATYDGICEASAAVALDESHFVVASDETNDLYLYKHGEPAWTIVAHPTGYEKSDIEAATRIDRRAYFLTSHSLTKKGKDKEERKVLFAMDIGGEAGARTLTPFGSPYLHLRDAMPPDLQAGGMAALNIEGMAASPNGELIIGLRAPLTGDRNTPPRDRKARILVLKNPDEILKPSSGDPVRPDLKEASPIWLDGRGVRSLEHIGRNGIEYLVVAGPVCDCGDVALYSWNGPKSADDPVWLGDLPDNFRAEAMIFHEGADHVQILSDDGDGIDGSGEACSDEDGDPEERHFRSIDWPLPAQ